MYVSTLHESHLEDVDQQVVLRFDGFVPETDVDPAVALDKPILALRQTYCTWDVLSLHAVQVQLKQMRHWVHKNV